MLDGLPHNYPISIGPQALPLQAAAGARQWWEGQMSICLRRRDFIAGLGGAAAWPLAARAQQDTRMRRVGMLIGSDENDPEGERRYSAFTQALAGLGWTEGRNLRIDFRWSGSDGNRIPAL